MQNSQKEETNLLENDGLLNNEFTQQANEKLSHQNSHWWSTLHEMDAKPKLAKQYFHRKYNVSNHETKIIEWWCRQYLVTKII